MQNINGIQDEIDNITVDGSGIEGLQNQIDGFQTDINEHQADGASHSKTARFVIGTSTAGWTATDCDYLCDGIQDQVEIIAALNELPVTGGEIIVLDGTYNITAKIDVTKDNVSIIGNGNATILKRMFTLYEIQGVITLTGRSGCKIANLQIEGNRTSYPDGLSVGIGLNSSSNCTVTGNTCNNNGVYGIYLAISSNNIVTGNICNNNDNDGIYLLNSSNNTVTGNTCNNNDYGIRLNNSSNNTVTGNTCFRGTGLATDYTESQHTIQLSGTGNSYNLIAMNNCMGKAVTNEGATGNSVYGNKYDSGDYTDFTQDEKTKLAGIEVGANNYTHPATHSADMITGLPTSLPASGGNADTVGGFTVGVNVPADAVFTDTVYSHPPTHPASMITESTTRRFVSDAEKSTWNSKPDTDTITTINGKTGAITKADITALGIPAQDTVVDISGKADITYVDSQDALKADKTEVAASLELKADKTYVDSLYIDAGGSIDLALLELKTDKTYVDNKVQTDVPANAKFTDTITTINGKTGAISKADIVALGIPAQDTIYTHPSSHPASMITESTIQRFVSDAEKAEWNSKSIKNIGTFNSHEELIMYAITEQLPTGQYAFFMGDAGHASLMLVRDAGTYYEGMAQGSDGLYVIFDVTKQGQMREYGELYAKDIIASFDDIRSIFSELDDKVNNSRVLTDVPVGAKFTDTVTSVNGKTGVISKEDIVALGIPSQDTTYNIATTSANGLMSSTDKQNLEENTTSRHTHINKAVIDKFSEVDNKPYYDGVEIGGGGSIVLGTTSSTAFRGDYGQTAYTHSQSAHAPTNAQKNSDITKAEIEAKLTGIIDTHTHPGVVSIVDLGTFNGEEELITHVVTNQLPSGHYTFTMGGDDSPNFILLRKWGTYYDGTIYNFMAQVFYFKVSFYGEILELKEIDLKALNDFVGLGDFDNYENLGEIMSAISGNVESLYILKADRTYVDEQDALKADISYVDSQDLKQMPISGGVLENYREKLVTLSGTSTDINLSLGNVFTHTLSGNTTYSISNAVSGQAHSFTLIINMGETARTLTFPSSVKWQGGEIPDLSTASKTYVLTFMTIDGGNNWLGMFGGEF